MKNKIYIVVALLAIFIIGILCGQMYQIFTAGYFYEEFETKAFPFEKGHLKMSRVNEYNGFRVINTETSVLTLVDEGGLPIVLYKAQRIFQESYPHIKDITTEKDKIRWTDGMNTYQLIVKPINKEDRKTEQ